MDEQMIVNLDVACPYCGGVVDWDRHKEQFVFGSEAKQQQPCPHLLWLEVNYHTWELLEDGSTRAGRSNSERYDAVNTDEIGHDFMLDLAMQALGEFAPAGEHSIQDREVDTDRRLTSYEIRRMREGLDDVGKESSFDDYRVHDFHISGQAVFAAEAETFRKECAEREKSLIEHHRRPAGAD